MFKLKAVSLAAAATMAIRAGGILTTGTAQAAAAATPLEGGAKCVMAY